MSEPHSMKRPEKPYPGFPLFPHANGQWAKKIRGRTHYFGSFSNGWEAAEALYHRQREDLHAGREPRECDDELTVPDLFTLYLEAAEVRVATGEMNPDSWKDTQRTGKYVSDYLGRNTPVAALRVTDFEALRGKLMTKFALSTVAGHIARTKAVLKWAYDVELVDEPIRVGPNFKRPSAKQFRRSRAAKPVQMFTPSEIQRLAAASGHSMRAMLLLGINAALGNRDCGELEFHHIDLDGGWITYPRAKTGIARRAKLWPETIEAIQESIAKRRSPRDKKLCERVFLTKYGQAFAKDGSRDSPISKEMAKLIQETKLPAGRNFYALRHTFRTIADECGDQPAVMHIMGHIDASISGVYRERIIDARLEKISTHVRQWYLAGLKQVSEPVSSLTVTNELITFCQTLPADDQAKALSLLKHWFPQGGKQ